MLHTDMAIIDSMVAARQEQVAASIWESHRRISLIVSFGSLLVRIGQWMKNDPEVTKLISGPELQACFDLEYHLKHVDTIFARVFGAGAP